MASVILDFDPPQPNAPGFSGDTADLVWFLSWAYAARYGGSHELSLASVVLRRDFKIDLRPLLTFADRDVEEPADAEALERAWQDAGPLAECCDAVVAALDARNEQLQPVQLEYPRLRDAIDELGRGARWAARRGARIRLTYTLDDAS